ncbi:MAG: hypothetical protein ACKV2T_20625 [Kofleriaceae bacterium]
MPEQRAIRDRIVHASSFLLGAPLWMQDKPHDEDDDGFVAQISDNIDDRLNFGDGGALYLFKTATVYQGR